MSKIQILEQQLELEKLKKREQELEILKADAEQNLINP